MKRTFKTYLEESYKGGVKTSDSASDKFEQKIAENVKSFCLQNGEPYSSLKVVKYDGEDNKYYSDIKVTNPKNNINVWIEVKKDKYANYGNSSFTYSDREWKCSTTEEDNPLTKYFIDILTEYSQKFIDFCHQKLGDDFELPRDLPDVIDEWKKAGMIDDTDNNVLFITEKIEMEEFGKKISEFYQTAKREPVYYIQVGDELFIIDSNYNPLNLKTHDGNDLKPLSEVHKRGRIQFRAKGIEKLVGGKKKYYYNITCDLKILKDENKDETEYNCSFSDESKYPMVIRKLYESSVKQTLSEYLAHDVVKQSKDKFQSKIVFKKVQRDELIPLLNKIETYIESKRFKRKQFEKYLKSDKMIDREDKSMYYGLFGLDGHCLALSYLNKTPEDCILVAEIQCVIPGYGKLLLQDIINRSSAMWLAADPEAEKTLLDYYRKFGLEEVVIGKSKWANGKEEHFFLKASGKNRENILRTLEQAKM